MKTFDSAAVSIVDKNSSSVTIIISESVIPLKMPDQL